MRTTRKLANLKAGTAKKTLPATKSAGKAASASTGPSAVEAPTRKTADKKRGVAAKAKQAKKSEGTPAITGTPDSNPEQATGERRPEIIVSFSFSLSLSLKLKEQPKLLLLTFREPDAEVMSQVKTVFLDGVPPQWDEDHVREQLKGYGEMVRVVLARNMSTANGKHLRESACITQ